MPYKSEKIRLPETLDRRRRLSDADKAEIERRYKAGVLLTLLLGILVYTSYEAYMGTESTVEVVK